MEKLVLIGKDLITVIVGILILIGIVLLLRRAGGRDVSYGDKAYKGEGVPEPFEGIYDGVEYAAECLGEGDFGGGMEPFMVVHIGTEKDVANPLEIDAREKRPEIANDLRTPYINALLDMGATYVDIGYNCTDWIAAEFPRSRATVDRAFAEKAVLQLAGIMRNSSF